MNAMLGCTHETKADGTIARRMLEIDTSKWLGQGAAAKVHEIRSKGFGGHVAKIYKDASDFDQAKIDAMLRNSPAQLSLDHAGQQYPQFAWPTSTLFDGNGKPIGYLMPRIDEAHSTTLEHF